MIFNLRGEINVAYLIGRPKLFPIQEIKLNILSKLAHK